MQEAGKQIGNRAEEVAAWYFRLNGFFIIPSYIIHKDYCAPTPKTEADIIGVRFRHSAEYIRNKRLEDDSIILTACQVDGALGNLFALVEVKSGVCAINGPWSKPEEKNINRAIERIGFVEKGQIDSISATLYEYYRWEDSHNVIQYFCVGSASDPTLSSKGKIIQITYQDIANFLFKRFRNFPEKIPTCPAVDLQWPGFGRDFAYWYDGQRHHKSLNKEACYKVIKAYIRTGSFY